MSEFGAINTALTGLLAARQALDTTGHNVSNANTPGYTRQTVEQSASGSAVVPAFYATTNGAGGGVMIQGVTNAADLFLDQRALLAHADNQNLNTTQSILNRVQLGFAEPGPNGLSAQLSAFWSSWDNLANNPTDVGVRTALLGAASTLTSSINQAAAGITSARAGATSQALSDVSQVNADAAQIASLNNQIEVATASGLHPNDLIDQRNQTIQSLGALAGVTTQPGANGSLDVYIGTNALVRGSNANAISAGFDSGGNVALTWNLDHSAVPAGGELGALTTAVNTTLPGLLSGPNGLDSIAQSLASTVNAAQAAGVYWTQTPGSNPPAYTSTAGPPMFGQHGGGAITAAGLTISPSLTASQLAASAPPPAGGPADGSNAQAIAEFANSTSGPDAGYRAYIGNLGSVISQVNNQASVSAQVTQQVDTARSSAEGVNIDEEMTKMVAYQQAYTASAKFLTAYDQTIQALLNTVQ